MAQLVRAPPCHGGGRGFESLLGRLKRGILAQLGEHLPYKQRVTGSSPVGPIKYVKCADVAQFLFIARGAIKGRAADYKSAVIEYADVAQLAEQLICNQQVIGSSPIIGFYGWIPERPKGADCKSVVDDFEGSNPSPSI